MNASQLSLWDWNKEEYKVKKPIRLIEMFSGYGSQALALKYLGANFEHWKICEWAVKSIQAYKDLHIQDETDYSKDLTRYQVEQKLVEYGISNDYNKPMTLQQIKRKQEQWQRQVYNNIIATHNLVDVSRVHGSDLEIENIENYDYIMTYSFPCQDISISGNGGGVFQR